MVPCVRVDRRIGVVKDKVSVQHFLAEGSSVDLKTLRELSLPG